MNEFVDVTVQLPIGGEVVAGTLESVSSRTGSVPTARFRYNTDYLEARGSYNLSPDLYFSSGLQETPVHRQMFLAFEDAAPDRWGRDLIQEEARFQAKRSGEYLKRLSAYETLIRVPDNTRQGALRFWQNGVSVGADAHPDTVKLIDWASLVDAAESFNSNHATEETLKQLFRYGSSSPGGARPKTNVIGDDGRLKIAKLPHKSDRWDVSRWEAVALTMARQSGILVPDHLLHSFDVNRSILLLDRFDRGEGGVRRGYISARTLLQVEDHDVYRGSYVHFAERLREVSGRDDLHELFRRIVFTLLVTNADDHMRNHGLLRGRRGWQLAPSFDVNPERNPSFDSTPISRDGDPTARELRELFELRDAFDLSEQDARQIIIQVEQSTRDWCQIGIALGEDPGAMEFFAPMFEGPNREWASSL